LYKKGWQQNRIAEALGVTKGAVSQWLKKAKDVPEEEQERALTVKKSTGRKPVVTAELRRKLLAIIDRGAESFGLVGEQWTAPRLQTVIRRELGIRLGVTTIKKFLHQEGYSVQKPVVSATQKNEKAVAGFRGGWGNLKKGQPKQAQP
jgi:transposase